MKDMGFIPCGRSNFVFARGGKDFNTHRTYIVFVDADACGDWGSLVNSLLAFRARFPQALVCLLSDNFSSNDFGTERIFVCDGSILKPSLHDQFDKSLARMQHNNEIWLQRFYKSNVCRNENEKIYSDQVGFEAVVEVLFSDWNSLL
jgi:hypothetical protein